MKRKKSDLENKIIIGDSLEVLKTFPDNSIQCIITSPPYWGLRDYGFSGQIGMESSFEEYIKHIVTILRESKRILKHNGTLWLNLGDCYSCSGKGGGNNKTSLEPKNLIGLPWRIAFALQADGWYLRSDIIWAKPNPMPESVVDRPTRSHEYLFLLTKSRKYYYDNEAIKEPLASSSVKRLAQPTFESQKGGKKDYGSKSNRSSRKALVNLYKKCGPNSRANVDRVPRKNLKQDAIGKGNYVEFNGRHKNKPIYTRNKRDVWNIAVIPYKGAHFATFPEKLVEPCVLAGSKKGDIVMDIFAGSGTTLAVAEKLGRKWVGIEGNKKYLRLIKRRLKDAKKKK